MQIRPVGVAILAVLDFVGAGLMALCGLALIIGISVAAHATWLSAMGVAGGIVCILVAVVPALVGRGLWRLKNWARALTIVFAALGIVVALFGFVSPQLRLVALLPLLVNGIVAAYLMRDDVKRAFA
jgi:uncharacterized membrane protein (DUF2068 family)